jgi:hypothetical protein
MSNCPINTTFKEVKNIGDDFLLNILESNFKIYLDWSFLNIGAWFDVNSNDQTIFGVNSHSKLNLVKDPTYADGQVWQSIRKDWVWEKNIDYNGSQPIIINSVTVDSNIVNKNNFTIDYPLGRIIFNSAISTSSEVKISYSYRFIQTYRSCDVPWFNILQYGSFNTANPDITRSQDGDWSIGSYHRIQMPCIIIDSAARSRSMPYELGNSNLKIEQDIVFYILAENKNDRNKLLDILRLQQDSFIYLFNTNLLSQDEKYPLDYNGDLIDNPLMYPDIVNTYKWRKCWIKTINLFEIDSVHPNLYQGAARATVEIISS